VKSVGPLKRYIGPSLQGSDAPDWEGTIKGIKMILIVTTILAVIGFSAALVIVLSISADRADAEMMAEALELEKYLLRRGNKAEDEDHED